MRLLATLFLSFTILHSIAQVPLRGLVAYYPFDNNAIDKSGNRNDGEVLAGVQTSADRNGNACGAMTFDGSSGYISVPNSSSLQSIHGSVTVATWFKLDTPKANEARVVLFSKGSTGSNPKLKQGYHVEYLQNFNEAIGALSLCCGFATEDKAYSTHRIEYNQWYHIVLVYDESWINLYLNGKLVLQGVYSQPILPNDFAANIGRNLGLKPAYLKGSFDEYRIYNRGLSAGEVVELYKYTPPTADSNVLAMYVPADIAQNTDADKCAARVIYNEPTANVGCGKAVLRLAGGMASGSVFPLGTSTITYEAKYEEQKEVAAFNIVVYDGVPPVFEYAREVTAYSYDTAGTTVNYLLGVSDNCRYVESVRTMGPASGTVFPIGKTEIRYEAKDLVGNKANCSFIVNVVKDDAPAVKRQEEPIAERADARPAPKLWDGKKEGGATIFKPIVIARDSTEGVLKTTVLEAIKQQPVKPAVTEANKPTTAPVAKPVVASTPAKAVDVACGADIVKNTDAGKCGAVVNYNAPKQKGQTLLLAEGIKANELFPVGITRNQFSLTGVEGFANNCHFSVKISDKEKPSIVCRRDTIIMLSYNRKGIIYNYTPPTATDNCGIDSFIQTLGSAPGCFLPIGEHPFSFEAIDASGNKTVCGFSVSVRNSGSAERVEVPQRLDEKLNMGDDAIKYEHEEEVGNCLLTVFVYDDGEEDGDSVSLVFDGQVLVDHQKLRLKENGTIKRQIALVSGNPNYIVAKAWNTGRTGLNTMRMDIYEGFIENEKRDLRGKKPLISKILHARPGEASGIILKCKW